MRKIILGIAVLGTLTMGAATARANYYEGYGYGYGCGPHCQHERWEHERWERHERGEAHRRWERRHEDRGYSYYR